MSNIILPNGATIIDNKLYVLTVFVMNDAMQLVPVEIFPQPDQTLTLIPNITKTEFKGASLTKIKAHMQSPVDKMLATAREIKECKVMFIVTELERFKEQQARAATLHNIQATKTEEKDNDVKQDN